MDNDPSLFDELSASVPFLDSLSYSNNQSSPISVPPATSFDYHFSLPLADTTNNYPYPPHSQSQNPFTSSHAPNETFQSDLFPPNVFANSNTEFDSQSVDDTSSTNHEPRRETPQQSSSSPEAPIVSKKPPSSSKSDKSPLPTDVNIRPNASHTRRCRAKLKSNFDRLLEVLPPPPNGVEVKHKAQILQYAIEHFRYVRCKNTQLEMELALSSPSNMYKWVQSVVTAWPNMKDSLKAFMAMICLTKKWKYAELWAPSSHAGSSDVNLKYISGSLPPTVKGEELERLRSYRTKSRNYKFRPRCGVPGRVFLTMRPEWLPLLNDPISFPRAPHAVQNRLEVTFAVPIIVSGSVQMVVEFYDTDRREYDPSTLNVANEIAVMFGKAFAQQQSWAHGQLHS